MSGRLLEGSFAFHVLFGHKKVVNDFEIHVKYKVSSNTFSKLCIRECKLFFVHGMRLENLSGSDHVWTYNS